MQQNNTLNAVFSLKHLNDLVEERPAEMSLITDSVKNNNSNSAGKIHPNNSSKMSSQSGGVAEFTLASNKPLINTVVRNVKSNARPG